jgi:hypothetical protein
LISGGLAGRNVRLFDAPSVKSGYSGAPLARGRTDSLD